MPTYLTRVELHRLAHNSSHYADLHAFMAAEGFVRSLVDGSGNAYRLPAATYAMPDTQEAASQVDDRAAKAAGKTLHSFSTLTVSVTDWWCHNLPSAS